MSISHAQLHQVVRQHYGPILARLIRTFGDFHLAEDALQEALTAALLQWQSEGVPDSPRAWLLTAARNKAVDEVRRRVLRGAKHEQIAREEAESFAPAPDDPSALGDDMLRLMFTCCHPALELSAQVALTLNTVAGLRVEEIARAFLVPVPTMAQRLVRAKRKIVAAKIPYIVPERQELGPRTDGLLRVLYLIFNEGYASTRGADLIRHDLCDHAIHLGREVTELLPEDGSATGLLALMLLQDSRRAARVDDAGDLILLDDQLRSLWDQSRIQEGCELTRRALTLSPHAPYAIQAAIAAVHAEAAEAAQTDWPQILGLYDRLLQVEPSAVVALNRAVAVAMAHGPEAGLALTAELEDELQRYHWMHAARGELLRRAGQLKAARAAFEQALALCDNDAERRLLSRKLAAVSNKCIESN